MKRIADRWDLQAIECLRFRALQGDTSEANQSTKRHGTYRACFFIRRLRRLTQNLQGDGLLPVGGKNQEVPVKRLVSVLSLKWLTAAWCGSVIPSALSRGSASLLNFLKLLGQGRPSYL